MTTMICIFDLAWAFPAGRSTRRPRNLRWLSAAGGFSFFV